jgi:hypothetical protein
MLRLVNKVVSIPWIGGDGVDALTVTRDKRQVRSSPPCSVPRRRCSQ